MAQNPLPPGWPGLPSPLDWIQAWGRLWQPAPRPPAAAPGRNFEVDSGNSSSPQTEADIVSRFSYGAQLGKINDALAWLVAQHPEAANSVSASEFVTMKNEIDLVKAESARRRLERVAADLAILKQGDPAEFRRVSARLRDVLGE